MIFFFFISSSLLFSSLLFSSLLFSSLLSSLLLLSLLLSPSPLFFFFFFFSFSSLFYKHTRMTVKMGHTLRRNSNIYQKPFILSCFGLSSLSSFSVFFLCLLFVCVVVCVVVWCACGVVCAVWCGTLRTPCVDSKRLRVYIQTRAHGGHRQFCLPRKSPRKVITCFRCSPKVTTGCCPRSSLRTDREQHDPDSSNHSLCLIKLLSSSYCGESLEGTSREMVRFVFRSNEKSITNDLRVSIS